MSKQISADANALFAEDQLRLCQRVDRTFYWLMMAQWALAVVLAFFNSASLSIAFLLGGLLSLLPLSLVVLQPGKKITRYSIVTAQMLFSALFLHLLNGQVEARFHVFGSLAFIAAYRDWRLLILASTITISDHFLLGLYHSNPPWAWLEYAGWILFENIFLGYACIQATKEMQQAAEKNIEFQNLSIQRAHFFSVIGHEIRTPLNGIIGFADFLKETPPPEEQKQYVSIIKQCSDTLLKLINDLLDFNKIDSGHLEIDLHRFKLQDIRTYLENIFSLECKKKNLKLCFDIAEETPTEFYGDSYRIRQVLSNLICNAIKFTENGEVRVRLSKASEKKDLYRWDVEDTGVGMQKDSLEKIFSPYTQEFSSTARNYGGSGLGLSISKKLVELMGGEIRVESTLGKGTRFVFTTPLQ